VTTGVLALQGDSEAHLHALRRIGAVGVSVRTAEQLAAVDRLILPGGESTTISMLLASNGLVDPLAERIGAGMPVFGTCAGMILLATHLLDGRPDQIGFGAIDLTVRRNGFGRQLDSFETDLVVAGLRDPFHAVFIRAPLVERAGPAVEVLASIDDVPVLCRSGPVLASAFHPELSGDARLHELFCDMVAA